MHLIELFNYSPFRSLFWIFPKSYFFQWPKHILINYFHRTFIENQIGDFFDLVNKVIDSNSVGLYISSVGAQNGKIQLIKNVNFGILNEIIKEGIGFTLPDIPECLFNLKYLDTIYFRESNLVTIPKSIEKLKMLKRLELGRNMLKSLPDEIGNLNELEYFDLSSNCLEKIPKSISKLTNLKELDLSANKIKSLPNISALKNLKNLILVNNPNIIIPKNLWDIDQLRVFLDASQAEKLSINDIDCLNLSEELWVEFEHEGIKGFLGYPAWKEINQNPKLLEDLKIKGWNLNVEKETSMNNDEEENNEEITTYNDEGLRIIINNELEDPNELIVNDYYLRVTS